MTITDTQIRDVSIKATSASAFVNDDQTLSLYITELSDGSRANIKISIERGMANIFADKILQASKEAENIEDWGKTHPYNKERYA